jgi:hypothetical protein
MARGSGLLSGHPAPAPDDAAPSDLVRCLALAELLQVVAPNVSAAYPAHAGILTSQPEGATPTGQFALHAHMMVPRRRRGTIARRPSPCPEAAVRASRVPHRTDNCGTERTTTVTNTAPMSW